MNTFSEGDLVEATKGERCVIDRVRLHADFERLWIDGVGFLNNMSADNILEGHTLTLIERAAPALPTEPGHYLRESRDCVYTLSSLGDWWYGSEIRTDEQMPDRVPLTRLEPVADTAKKVADWIDAGEWSWGKTTPALTNAIRNHFGVTS